MNEKIDALAVLFARRAEIDKEILALLDGEPAEEVEQQKDQEDVVPKKGKKRKAGRYNKHNPMPDEVKESIRAKATAGATGAELAKEFEVSNSSIFKVLNSLSERMTTKGNEVKSYVCENGHEFNSKLPSLEVICPVCHSTDCELGTLNGEVEEGTV